MEGIVFTPNKNYTVVRTVEEVERLVDHIQSHDIIAYDTEATSLNVRKGKVIGFSVCGLIGESYYFPMLIWSEEVQHVVPLTIGGKSAVSIGKKILKMLQGKKLVMHNASYDCRITKNDLKVDLLPSLFIETMLLIHTVQEEGVGRGGAEVFGLKKVAIAIQDKIGLDVEKAANEEQIELRKSILDHGGSVTREKYEIYKGDLNVIGKYAAADTDLTLRICYYYWDILKQEGLEEFFFEKEVMPVCREVTIPMEERGISLDIPLLEKTKREILQDMSTYKKEIIDALLSEEPGQRWVVDTAFKNFPVSNKGTWASAFIDRYSLPLPRSEKTGRYSISKANIQNLEDCWQKDFLMTGDQSLIPEKEKVRISLALWKDLNDGDYFNVQSASQLSEIVFDYYGEKPIKTNEETGKDSFDGMVIQEMSKKYEWCESLRIYRKLQKIYTTYIERFLSEHEDGKYYFYYKQHGTVSGRYASNAQQLPKPMEDEQDVPIVVHYNRLVRRFLISGPGYKFVDADYESLEPHCFAFVSGDQGLRDIFNNGWDFYSTIGIKTEKLDQDKVKYPNGVSPDKKAPNFLKRVDPVKRNMAKGYALGVPYGMTAYALGKRLGCSTKEAQGLIDGYFDGFPELKKWYDGSRKFMYENGYMKNYLGRVRHLKSGKEIYDMFGENILDSKFRAQVVQQLEESGMSKHEAEKEVIKIYMEFKNQRNNCLNYQLQSLGAGIVNRAALAVNRKAKELGIDAQVVAQVHDQIVVLCEESRAEEFAPWVEKLMSETTILPGVPLTAPAEIGRNMAESH